ncbi:MAG: tetratricopeptide repeat protein [Gammaproteobacteria bacterium]
MDRHIKKILKGLIPVLLIFSNTVVAAAAELDEAVKIYYAGFPDQAIRLIKPLAVSGDVDAQYLLGNILYSLSKTKKYSGTDDPVKWYKMAAAQGSPAANYALGAIFHNRWSKSKRNEDVALAISYYQKAVELGYKNAQVPLTKLVSRREYSAKSKPLSHANASIEHSKRASQISDENSSKEPGTVELASIAKQIPVEVSASEPDAVNLAGLVKQIPGEDSAGEPGTVDLADIANQCSNYTQTGFDYYAESIKGAYMVGNAKIDAVLASASNLNTRLLRLTKKQFGIVINLTLNEVPKEIATGLKQGRDFGITGIVEQSQMTGSSCDVILRYQSTG